jgi:hypothetical protein
MTMVPIQSISLSTTGQIIFSNIPQTYKHLQIRLIGRGAQTFADGLSQYIFFNGDTSSNYTWHTMFGFGTGVSTSAAGTFPTGLISSPQILTDASAPSNLFGAAITDIYNYSNTSTFKTIKTFGGFDKTVSGRVTLSSGTWASNLAINSIRIESDSGLVAGTRADLYGIVG